MIDYIKNWWRACKERDRLAETNKKREEFYIKEKNGALWIIHSGTAVDMIPPFASSEEIVRMLEETRSCAVEYEYGIYSDNAHQREKHLNKIAKELIGEEGRDKEFGR